MTISKPSFVTNDPEIDKRFDIYTTDTSLEGQYLITVTASIPNT